MIVFNLGFPLINYLSVLGVIEFDFSGASRAYKAKLEINTDNWFVSTLVQVGVITESRVEESLKWLSLTELKQRKNSTGAGLSYWQRDQGRSAHISTYLYEKIYHPSQLSNRFSRYKDGIAKERNLQAELLAKEKAKADEIAAKKRSSLWIYEY